ncbi:DUF3617 domain-containing protein [Sphingomonas sp.]|uniref:DUF3617 domain-containing protein n=1 Tax=Sphingomonas sp. TaxID=28214 RepID=UPI002DD65337|nr:DUF3617 domain-containing protein [Sphingomonas sp.]
MRNIVLPAGLLLALAGCGGEPTVTAENASIAEVAAAAQGAVKMEPGKWETRVTIDSAEAPGMPPQAAAMMKQQMASGTGQVHTSCVTKEMAEKPTGELFSGKDNGECRYDRFSMAGGRIDAVMTCSPAGQPDAVKMTTSGDFAATEYKVGNVMEMAVPGAGKMTVRSTVAGKRLGACDA